jgi:uncharacterized protein
MSSTFLTANWKNLIMANYVVDPAILKPYLPAKTELDHFNGNCYVSLVGFMFMNTRLKGFKIPFHINFEEVNLRFYVKYNDNGEWKRGTVFIKEIVPRRAISFLANRIYHENYSTMRMDHFYLNREEDLAIGYLWRHWYRMNRIEAITEKTPLEIMPGSKEEFITEHYWGYTKYNDSTTFEYQVQHPAWKLYPVKYSLVECNFRSLYGNEFAILDKTIPDSVFVAEGSPVSILSKRKL